MKLKEIREAKGITQRQAALGLNLSPSVYNRYENGLREPSNALLPVIADYFGVTVDELLGREKYDPTAPEEQEEAYIIRERLRRDPAYRMLYQAADKAKPEHLRAAAAMLKSLEGPDDD
jgi:transcriptional regulator with XRE-family HTH domain